MVLDSPSKDEEPVGGAEEEIPAAAGTEGETTDAGTPPANDGEQRSTADVLNDVLNAAKSDEEDSPTSEQSEDDAETDPAATKAKGEDESDDLTEEQLAEEKPRTRKRMEKLLGDLKTRKEQLAKYERFGTPEEIEQVKTAQENLYSYMREANLNLEEVNTGFEIMRLMKNDPMAALKALSPYVESLRTVTGEVLPEDLQREVDAGAISEARAFELSRARSRAHLSSQEATRAAEKAREIESSSSRQTLVTEIDRAVSQWESQWQASDPDYSAKQDRVQERIELMAYRNGGPKTPQAAVDMAQKALESVNAEFKRLTPRKSTPVDPPVTQDSAAGQAHRQPASTLDALEEGLRRASAG